MAQTVLIEARPMRAADAVPQVVRLAGLGSRPYTHRGTNDWMAGVMDAPRFASMIGFGQGGWTGGAVPTTGAITFAPSDRARIDALAALVWADAAITIWTGDDAAADPAWSIELVGTVAGFSVRDGTMTITVADLSNRLARPIAADRFAGTGGIEGEADARERLKRRSFGWCWGVEARLLDKAANIHEVGDPARPLGAIDAVKDRGRAASAIVSVAWAGSIAATLAALKAAAVPEGGAAVAPSIACLKWWTQPSGPLTVDLRGEIGAGYVETVAEIAARIASVAGLETLDVAAAVAIRPGAAGLHVDSDSETAAQALDRLLLRASLLWLLEPAGAVRLLPVGFDAAAPIVEAIEASREASYKPVTRIVLGYQRNHRLHDAGEISAVFQAADGTYADGTPIENLKPAEGGATKGAPEGTYVGGKPVEAVIEEIEKITPIDEAQQASHRAILDVQLLAEERRLRYEDLTHVGGMPVGTVVKRVDQERLAGDTAIREIVDLIGAKTADGRAFMLSGVTVLVQPGKTLAERLTEFVADADLGGEIDAKIVNYDRVLTGDTGAIAQSIRTLETKMTGANGPIAAAITGYDRATVDPDDPKTQTLAETVKSLRTTSAGHTASIDLIARTINGEEADVRLILSVDGRISGMRFRGSTQAVAFDVMSFSLVHPTTGKVYFFADADGRVKMQDVEVDTIKVGSVGSQALASGSVSFSNFATVPYDVACSRSVATTVVAFDFVKLDSASTLKVQMFAQCYHADDLQFDADIMIDGQRAQRATVRMPFDNSNSQGQAPVTPSAFIAGIPAGQHSIAFVLTSHETEGPTYVRAGSTLEVTELRGAAIANARQTTGGSSSGEAGGGTGGGSGGGGNNEEVLN